MLSLHWYFYTSSSNLKEEMCNVYAFVCGRSFIPHLTHLLLRYFDKNTLWSEETKGSNILSMKSNFSTLSSDVLQVPLQWLWLDSWLHSASPRARCATTPSCSKVQARCVHEARRQICSRCLNIWRSKRPFWRNFGSRSRLRLIFSFFPFVSPSRQRWGLLS